jgi:hypothetical protein
MVSLTENTTMKRFQTIALLLLVLTGYLLPQSAKAGKLRTAHSEISFSPWSSTAGHQNPNGEGRYDPNIVSDGKHTSFSYEALFALSGEKRQEGTGKPVQIRSFESKVTPISPGSYTFSGKIKAGGWYASVFWTMQCLDGGGTGSQR